MSKTTLDGLAAAVAAELGKYSQQVADGVKKTAQLAAKLAAEEIAATSPVQTGSYKRGWRVKVAFEQAGNIRLVVHNETDYQITHLLENGFTGRSGLRVEGQPHIRPAEQRAIEKFVSDIERLVSP